MTSRRHFLTAAGAASALAALGVSPQALAAQGMQMGRAQPFSFEQLIARARDMARTPYQAPPAVPAAILDQIDYDAHGKIHFKTDLAVFAQGPGAFPLTFFHLGKFFRVPVRMFILDGQGDATVPVAARELSYRDDYFDMPADSPAHRLPAGSGFAGFRFQESRLADQSRKDWRKNDWVAFLGASYFRAIGDLYQYGLSARGIAIDVAQADRPEEFPDFTQFFFEPQAPGSETVVVYALLDGPSITGAYRFAMQRGAGVGMEIDKALFLRRDVARLGLAPATSMYWFSETVKGTGVDWRPEVHDSDGLAIWSGAGEHLWRPLNNPPRTMASAFGDQHLRGFGLLQRDRDFDHYLDGVHYERRPSLWVEPLGDWGEGAVQLIELRTDDEIHDNIVAMWVPKAPARAGNSYRLRYRLYWQKDEPFPTPLARCVATRLGRGGQPGQARPQQVRKFMVEFKGAPLENLPFGVKPEAVITASRGSISYVYTEALPNGVAGHWRAQFDLTADGQEPVELRLFLRHQGQALSETWLFQYHPFVAREVY
ncbi:glucan biosynthesis protein D [Herbaspirillum rubrisubalbicans]|jgi:glucans biosynthesis protein|uniref:Glucan biosynthesis protein D n=2 Tax=Herbaspirillum rubrisubalbicans TaxID=80842 RepID=A0ABX9BW71_9BURK|nr:glucan biosynthesis protein D [Herbaspirillum rubrisubalbicans]NQE50209.1 glucan biosynthesis protein D [Herbaspirillum rubrisubalbicans]QJQ02917.1 glucan biosynthesis protein D [Herbaspirillum rubrisubalbicans Os34]RAM62102.1 glucan biosynthesis protein D [Herbaspirillum rubrisubalbicans]RAN45241.1 glucan biosynthesis protein D [Herbaspirillum rubrisubalbicans]